jgi:uncharacterized repeat protein (TIGR01451 family)
VSGVWTAIQGGSGYQGIGTNEIRWGSPAGAQKSGLRFTNSGNQSFDTGATFYLGMLTHMNWGTYSGTAANGATLQITLNFDRPDIPNVVLDYDFTIEETLNTSGICKIYQRTLTPCDDKVFFPNSYGTTVFTIGDIQYTLVIDGFVDAYPDGNPVDAFITEEQKENSAFLVGHLSSVLVQKPEIRLTKKTNGQDISAAPGENLYVGDTVTWEYIVQNSGNVTLTNINLTDSDLGPITCPFTELAKGTTMTCTATGTVVAGQYENTATVVGTPPTGSNLSATDSSWYYGISKGSIKIIKNTDGGDGTFNFTSNIGLNSLTTTDGTASQTINNITPGTSYSISETVPSGWRLDSANCDNGTIDAIKVLSNQTTTCTFVNTKLNPALSVEKSSSTTSLSAPETVTYSYLVTNTGNVTLTGISLSDNNDNDDMSCPKTSLAPTETMTCSATHTFTQEELDAGGTLDNTVTASSNEGAGDTDDLSISMTQSPSLNVTKVATEDSVDSAGDVIHYTIKVENTGNQTLTGVSVNDPLLVNLDCDPNTEGYQTTELTINVNSTLTCVGTYTVTQDDIDNYGGGDGDIDNTVTAGSEQTIEDTASDTVNINGSITIIKIDNINSGTNFNFSFTPLGSENTLFILDDDDDTDQTYSDSITYSDLAPSFYDIAEISVPEGWTPSMVSCTTNYPSFTPQNTFGYGSMSVALGQGEKLVCTFENVRDTGSITVLKYINDLQNPAEDTWRFEVNGSTYLTDETGRTEPIRVYTGTSHSVGEINIPEGYQFNTAYCVNSTGGYVGTLNSTSSLIENIAVTKNDDVFCHFVNYELSNVHGYKWNDLDNSGTLNGEEPLLSGWTINLYASNGDGGYGSEPIKTMVTNSGQEHFGWYWFENLLPGDYKVCEVDQPNWTQTFPLNDDDNCHLISLPSGNSNGFALPEMDNAVAGPVYSFGNFQSGSITGAKYFDADQNGEFTEVETAIADWEITLWQGDSLIASTTTDSTGQYDFTGLKAGTYSVCEEDRTTDGWISTEPAGQLCREVVIDVSGELESANFGNFLNSQLYIEKTNNVWPIDQSIGDEVTYTIKLMALEGPVYDVSLFDLPPHAFSYVPGSYTASSSMDGDLKNDIDEPTYASPGLWELGDMVKDEIITLTYRAIIGDDADPGIYPDMAWAIGTSAKAQNFEEEEVADLLALSDPDFDASNGGVDFIGEEGHYGEEHFVGTQVAIVLDETPADKYKVEKIEEVEGQVLGASTGLPATGARFWLSLLAILSMLTGAGLLFLPNRSKRRQGKALLVFLMLGLGLLMAKPVQALTSVRIAQPYNNSAELDQDAMTNQEDFRIDFVILNTDNLSLDAQCQQQENGGAWLDIETVYTVKAGGNSGYCQAEDLRDDSQYDFRVVASDGEISTTVKVGLETDRPGKPKDYDKDQISSCKYEIEFRTADDGRTVSVEVYRSDDNESFTAKASSRIKTINIGPDEEYSFETTKPDCDKDYYYALRAFDEYGNASDLVGDREIKTVIIEGTSGETEEVTLGALPVTETVVLGEGEIGEGLSTEGTEAEGTEAGALTEGLSAEEIGEEEGGKILGVETESLMSFLTRVGLPILVGGTVLFLLYRLFFAKRNEK